MSSSCDKLAIKLLTVEEKKEERDNISSNIYDLKEEVKSKTEEYEEYMENGEYDELEDLLSEICALNQEIEEQSELLKEYQPSNGYV